MPPLPDVPTLSISYSTANELLTGCPRRWWLEHVAMWQGWPRGTRAHDPLASLAYRGKYLVTVGQLVGTVVHRIAAEVGRRWMTHGRGRTPEQIFEDARAQLADVARRRREDFVASPKSRMLLPHYRGETVTDEERSRARLTLQSAARRLADADLWADMMSCEVDDVRWVEKLTSVTLEDPDGHHPPVPFYGQPDSLYIARRTQYVGGAYVAPGQTGIPVVVEFKTSRGAAEGDRVRRQLTTMALAAAGSGVEPHPVVGYIGRVCDLSPAGQEPDPEFSIGRGDLDEAREFLGQAVRHLRGLATDERGAILGSEMPPAPGRRCMTCGVREACDLSERLIE